MNGKDKISVIIPCYNVQKYIMRCFDSIYSQTYGFENLEVILIDDLSTDNTWSILESLQRKYPENVISLKIQKKGKCGGARNLGMDICTGKYITFVDADDYVHPDMLRVLYDRMTEDDYDVAQCGVSCFKADKPNVLEVNDLEIQRLDLDNVDNRKNLIIGLTGFTSVTAWAKLYSTKFIREHNLRFIEDVYYEDTHFSMLCVLLAKKYCKVQSALYYYFENTEGIIRSEISNAKIRDAKIIMDHIRQAIQSRKAELGNVIEQCYCEIQTFLLWHQYIEPYSRIETFMNRELDICKEEFLKSEPDIFNNPYVKFFSDDVVLKRMSRLRVTAKKMNNVCFLDNAIHICLGIHDKDGNYSVWAGTTMQSIVENTKAPIVFHILHDDTLNEINKNKLSFIADNSGNDIEFHHFNSDVFGTFADSMNRFAIGTMFRIMLPDIMPDLKKIIYLDSDLFVNTDIEELWNLNIDNYCLAAAQDCSTIRNWGTPYAVAAGQTKVAQSIGCHEMGLSFYPLKPDYAKEIDKRLDGIIAPLNYGDIVIFQYPSWIGVNYDESFVNKIKSYRDTKLIIFVQDIQKLMFDSEQAILDMEIKTLNKADLLILPSKKMHRYLKENGLDEKPVIYQTIWDMPSDICFVDHAVTRCFHFAGNYNRFPFLAEYHGKTPIYQYDANKPDRENDDSFCWRGYLEQEKLMHELSKGGFGLVWSDDEYFDRYYSMNQPYKLGTNLAAGIPVIVKRGCVHDKFVERNGLGYAVDTLDEADKLVQSITDAEYIKLYHNVKNIQKLILDGAYTRKTLQDAIIEVLENACTPVENRYQDHI